MGFFTNLFKKKPAVERQDPVFGPIALDQGIWTYLPPAALERGAPPPAPGAPGPEYMVGVDAPESGPSDLQRAFFGQVRADLPAFEQRARDYLARRPDPPADPALLSAYALQIGNDDETQKEEFVLEMSDAQATCIRWVRFRAGRAVGCGCDD